MFPRTFILKVTFSFAIFCSLPTFSTGAPPKIRPKGSALNESVKRITVTASGEPSTFVNNVNVIFGNLLFASQDLEVPGPLPLNLIRYYNSENTEYNNWLPGNGMSTNYPLWIRGLSLPDEDLRDKNLVLDRSKTETNLTSAHPNANILLEKGHHHDRDTYAYALAELDGGTVVRCAAKFHEEKKNLNFYIDPETIHKGFTNAGNGEISARTNLKNISFHTKGTLDYKHGPVYKATWSVDLADGGTRIYQTAWDFFDEMYLKQEEKPNGNKLMFGYTGIDGRPNEIRASNHSHARDFGLLKIHHYSKKGGVRVIAGNGKEALYKSFQKKPKHLKNIPDFSEASNAAIFR